MYYFRDCYFDQRVAFGVARASFAGPHKPRTAPRRTLGSALDLITPFFCVGLTFGVGLMVLDILGLEHMMRVPSFEGAVAYLEYARSVVGDVLAKVPMPQTT